MMLVSLATPDGGIMTAFDTIATKYQDVASMAVRQALEDTMQRVIGDVAGKSVLDLACGGGGFTRRFKERGADRVVGVDISAEMLNLARAEEARDPRGIEY